MKFNKIKHVFLSGLQPDFFAGLPGFYLSAREQQQDVTKFKLGLSGPQGTTEAISKGKIFLGRLNHLAISEYRV